MIHLIDAVLLPLSTHLTSFLSFHTDSLKLPVNRRQSVYTNGTLIVHNAQKGTDDGRLSRRSSDKKLPQEDVNSDVNSDVKQHTNFCF